MTSLRVHWNSVKTAQGAAWADFFALDVDDPHFDGLEGVFVAWLGGPQSAVMCVGAGDLRGGIKSRRADPVMADYQGKQVFVSWAKVDKLSRPGVTRYLLEALKPRLSMAAPPDEAIEVNLPGRGDHAPPGIAAPALSIGESEAFVKAAAAERAAAVARVLPVEDMALTAAFRKLIDSTKEAKSGLFGTSARPALAADAVVGSAVQLILSEAVRMRASDIHLEPMRDALRVRYRIDGLMEEVLVVPHSHNLRIVSNVRVTCGLDPEKQPGSGGKPEDGRVTVRLGDSEADIRLSTFPTAYGDKAVLRVIPRSSKTRTLDELDLAPLLTAQLLSFLRRPQGLIAVTGPTGSGKSTTLYAALHEINDSSRNIVTLEDPVERQIQGITQGQISPKQGFGFAEGLRAILRQDPNVIMVGEIRDTETAEIALSASLTGHLLLTTLHTVSALGAINRLIDMGIEPFLVASALTAVTSQRLARAICRDCARPHVLTAVERAELEMRVAKAGIAAPPDFAAGLQEGAGCAACRGTGYLGRGLLFEIAAVTPPLREAILRKGSIDDLKAAAMNGGMEPILADGLRKAAKGVTSLAEVMRVVDSES